MRLQGKVAVVTGGGAGIGRGIALCMAREGADIAIPDIQDGNAHAVVKEVEKLGRKAVAMRCDVTKAADVKASLDRVKKELGRIDILVNNAGMASSPGMPFTNNTEEDWDKTYAVNLKSVFKGMPARQVFDKRIADIIPLKREQTPEDIGWAATFLASDEARNITGQALNVDGGSVMH